MDFIEHHIAFDHLPNSRGRPEARETGFNIFHISLNTKA